MFGKRSDPQARKLGLFLSTCRIGLGVGWSPERGDGEMVLMGPAEFVFDGYWNAQR